MSVYISITIKAYGREMLKVFPANEYQTSAFLTFMSNKAIHKIEFKYPGNINFYLKKMNTDGLNDDYSDFCVLENEKGENHILSNNEKKLKGYTAWHNRMSEPMGGNYKKKITQKKPVIKKKLTKKKRQYLANYIKTNALTYGISSIDNDEIDNKNILKSTLKAMSIATNIAYNKYKFNKIYIDGPYYNPYIPPGEDTEFIPYECINKGDSTYTCIAAASILAKEQHNENIIKLVNDNPELEKYDLINNHGYGTKKHLDAINKYGVTKWHRKSYKCCK